MSFSELKFIVVLTFLAALLGGNALAFTISEKKNPDLDSCRIALRGPIALSNTAFVLNQREEKHRIIIERASKFPCVLTSNIASSGSSSGDAVSAMLLVSIKAADGVVAEAGSTLTGWISGVYKKRRVLKARLSPDRWLNSNAGVKLHFDRVITGDGKVIRLSAEPAVDSFLIGSDSPFNYVVNRRGEIQIDYSGLKYGACGVAIQAAGLAAGPASLIVGPVLSGACGMASPSYALDRPVSEIDDQTRLKGLVQGAFKGLPGGSLILGAKHEGLSIEINAGTEIELELKQDLVISKEINASLL